MATNANWTVIFDDQLIIKKAGDATSVLQPYLTIIYIIKT